MLNSVLFELDTAGKESPRSNVPIYNTFGNIEITDEDIITKSSQERSIKKCKSKRYHQLDVQMKFIPGKISNQLRKALGLRMMDIPEHIYRMRHLGYPPGWLRKAEVTNDSITVFGADNSKTINKPSDGILKYDCDKLFEFPGFNSYHMYDYRYDMSQEFGFMPMQEDCLLQNFKKFLRSQQLLGKIVTDITEMRSPKSARNSATDFNLPLKRPITPEISTQNKNEDTGNQKSNREVLEESTSSSINISLNEDLSTENSTILIGHSILEKPSLSKFSEGINEHRLFENLPNVSGAYKKVKEVLKKIKS